MNDSQIGEQSLNDHSTDSQDLLERAKIQSAIVLLPLIAGTYRTAWLSFSRLFVLESLPQHPAEIHPFNCCDAN